jgi:hypothetical protein
MLHPIRLNQHATWYQLAAIGVWTLFLLRLAWPTAATPISALWELCLQGNSKTQLVLHWSAPSADVRLVKVVMETGEASAGESWMGQFDAASPALTIDGALPGRLVVKAVGLDAMGCSLFGGTTTAVVAAKPTSPLRLQIDLKKLSVPLCN